jgi:uncharacterized OsmC-like protein
MSTNKKNDGFNGVNTHTLNIVYDAMQNKPEMAKATFYVKSEWNGGFSVTSTSKGFRIGGQNIERNSEYKMQYDFPNQLSGQGRGLTVCLAQTIAAHATSRGIQIDGINIDVEGDVDLNGFTGISNDVRPGAQQFRVNINIKSINASKEQINELHEIGKRLSPAFDTLTNGTSVVLINS